MTTTHSLRVMTLNIARGARMPVPAALLGRRKVERNLDAVGAFVQKARADVVALQEVDRASFWSAGVDHFTRVAEASAFAHSAHGEHDGPACLGAPHGTALLSSAPLESIESVPFRTSSIDDKGLVVATVAGVDIVSVHLAALSASVRLRQIRLLADALRGRRRPLIVMGDMNATYATGECEVAELAAEVGVVAHAPTAPMNTYPSGGGAGWRRLDWILTSPELEVASYETLDANVSDHRAVVADVVWQ